MSEPQTLPFTTVTGENYPRTLHGYRVEDVDRDVTAMRTRIDNLNQYAAQLADRNTILQEQIDKLAEENRQLADQAAQAAKRQANPYQALGDDAQHIIDTAKRQADDTTTAATRKADRIIQNAHDKADKIINDARARLDKEEQQINAKRAEADRQADQAAQALARARKALQAALDGLKA